MGVSWMLELLATIFGGDSIWWDIPDVFNSLQGVFVFIIFVLNKKTFKAFKKTFCINYSV